MDFASIDRHNFDCAAAAAENAALRIAAELSRAVQQRGRATLAVSFSPDAVPLLRRLAETDILWSFISIVMADECYAPLHDPRSREAALRAALHCGRAAGASFIGLYVPARTTELAAFSASARVARLPRPFDCLILSMDEQGQTAGLYKGSSRLRDICAASTRALVLPNYVKSLGETRLTMTLPLLSGARLTVLPLIGKAKFSLPETACARRAEDMPIAGVLGALRERLQVYWSPN